MPLMIAQLFEICKLINLLIEGSEEISENDLGQLKSFLDQSINKILGLQSDDPSNNTIASEEKLIELLINLRLEARTKKDFSTSDMIRDQLLGLGIILKDTKEGTIWEKI
jgi:cysteinyl-tRNA synthetase